MWKTADLYLAFSKINLKCKNVENCGPVPSFQ